MSEYNSDTDGIRSVLTDDALMDLNQVVRAIESLEIQLSVLGVQMEYDQSRFSGRALDLAQRLGEVHEKLDKLMVFGS